MPSQEHLHDLMNNLMRVANKQLLVVEIEDPKKVGGVSKLLNKYWYEGFLNDVGEAYLTKEDFSNLLSRTTQKQANVSVSEFKNVMGNYMIANITKTRS